MKGWEKDLRDSIVSNHLEMLHAILERVKKEDDLASLGRPSWNKGEGPLHLAATWCHHDVIILLVQAGVSVNSYEDWGNDDRFTALHWAACEDMPEAVRTLLDLGADRDLQGQYLHLKGTPEDWARVKENKKVVEMLTNSEQDDDDDDCLDAMP